MSAEMPRTKGRTLFLKIFLVFVLAHVVASIATVSVTLFYSQEATERRSLEVVQRQLESLALRFQTETVTPLSRQLKLLSQLPTLDQYLRAGEIERPILLGELYRHFSLITKKSAGYRSVSFVDAAGFVRLHIADKRRRRVRTNLLKLNSEWHRLGNETTTEQMSILFSEVRATPLLLSSGNMEWFMPLRPIQISPIFRGADGRFRFFAAVGKLDVDTGRFGGAVMIQFDLQSFLESAANTSLYGVKPLWVFDENDWPLWQPETKKSDLFDPRDKLDSTFLSKPMLNVVDDGIVGEKDVSVTPNRRFFRLVFAVPRDAYLTDVDPLFLYFVVSTALSALLFVVIAVLASRYLSRPIIQLADTASQIADGELDTPVTVSASGEIGTLVDSFNRMTQELRDTIAARDKSLETLIEQSKQQETLIRDRVAAEAAAAAKSDFLAHMSHELRTPLNSIIGFTDLIHQRLFGEIGNEKYEEYIGDIRRSGLHLLELINDILDLSKIEAGETKLYESRIDIAELFSGSISIAKANAIHSEISIRTDIPTEFPDLLGDERLLRQILINLLSNAYKYTDPGGEILLAANLNEGGAVSLSVEDNGPGIAAADISRVLEPFGRVREHPEHAKEGTGLGLSLSKKMAELHGGDLSLESTFGRGTKVVVSLPPERTLEEDNKTHPATALPGPL